MVTKEPNKRLKAAREHKGWSQKRVAKMVEVQESTYQNWESGVTFPHPDNRLRLCEIFGASMEELGLLPSNDDAPAGTIELKDASEYRKEQGQYLQSNLVSRLLSIVDAGTYTDQRSAFAQIMEQFDAMNTENSDYQITRRQAVLSLATFPFFAPPLDLQKRDRVSSSDYELFVKECGASLAACEELAKSNDPDDLWLAFRCVSRYLVELEIISRSSSRSRTQALELATHCAILKRNLGWHCRGNTAALLFAQDAFDLALESGNVCLLLSASSKLAWGYLWDNQKKLALTTAMEARNILEKQKAPLPACIRGGIYSTLSVMQARNGQLSDIARKKAIEQVPGSEIQYGMLFTPVHMWIEQGQALYYARKPKEALEAYAQIVDPDALKPTKPFQGILTESQRIEIILDMSRASMKGQARNKGNTIRYWQEAIEGAKRLKSEGVYSEAIKAYDEMDLAFPDEKEVHNLLDHDKHW